MTIPDKEALRARLRDNLDSIIASVNAALRGEELAALEPILKRIGRGGELPHWYERLKAEATLPNLDGKTIGSVVEMLLVAVLETTVFSGLGLPPLRINPARGVDLPDLDLGVKSPSENFCTSEPFFSAYERLLGTEHDALVLLTDYQTAKHYPPLRLQIIKWRYLRKTQIADEGLCRIARGHREWLVQENPAWGKKCFRFLSYINQSDWRAKRLLKLVEALRDPSRLAALIEQSRVDFDLQNRRRLRSDKIPIPEGELQALLDILRIDPLFVGVIDAADNWVVEVQKDLGRAPNDNEWQRLMAGPLDGAIGMSFALQWRYNFGRLFGAAPIEEEENGEDVGAG